MVKSLLYLALIVLICSCTTTRKFDFRSAYKFRYLRYDHVNKTDSVIPLLASADKHMLAPATAPVIPEIKFTEKSAMKHKTTRSAILSHESRETGILNNSLSADRYSAGKTAVIPFKKYDLKSEKHINRTSGFVDLHPAFQGFIFVALGFGLIVAGSIITGIEVLPVVLLVAGIALVIFGFIKILRQL